jgi:uncharacterized membrane protein YoaT (DUF817 family)
MADRAVTYLDQTLSPRLRAALPGALAGPLLFALKLGWAALFAVLILSAIIVTRLIWSDDWPVARYDALVVFALGTQILFIWTRLETWEEARVIAIFHVTGTVMEIFKLSQGSWDYPDQGLLEIGGVPLFSGFMYASVGSFIARMIRLFHIEFAPYPPFWMTVVLALAIYVNFYTHHYTYDIRLGLFAATLLLFWRTRVWFYPGLRPVWVPLPVAALVSAGFLWIAENIGTFTQTWTYATQGDIGLVDFAKFGSWYLLLYVAFVTVTLVVRDALKPDPVRPEPLQGQRVGSQ